MPADTATAQACVFAAHTVTCSVDFVNAGLADGDDGVTSRMGDNWVGVSGGPGADVVRSDGPASLGGGPGPDDLIVSPSAWGLWGYGSEEPGAVTVDMDGVADDGHAGEGDNVRPGLSVSVNGDGDHVLIGDDAANRLAVTGLGDVRLIGGGGPDNLDGAGEWQ